MFWSRLVLCIALLTTLGCSGVYMSPGVNAPALRKAGQFHASASMRLFQPQNGANATVAYAVTDLVRVGATATGSFAERKGYYAEGLIGVEPWVKSWFGYGVLGGAGYGDVTATHPPCEDNAQDFTFCISTEDAVERVSATYRRYFVQGYLTLSAPVREDKHRPRWRPTVAQISLGLRAAIVDMDFHRFDDLQTDDHGVFGALEPFAIMRAGWRRVQFEPQIRYVGLIQRPRWHDHTVVLPEQLMFSLGFRVLLGPL